MLDVIKFLGTPGSVSFLVLSVIAGALVVRYWRRLRVAALAWLGVVTMSYIVLAIPIVANAVAGALPGVNPADPTERISTLIVLDGDNRRGRVRERQRVIASDTPSTIWVLGGRWILEALDEVQLSGPTFRYDASAGTTREQMNQVSTIAGAAMNGSTAVIASRLQAPRVEAIARKRHLGVRVLASPVDADPATSGIRRYLPTYIALRLSRDALYEHVALLYYRLRGWTD